MPFSIALSDDMIKKILVAGVLVCCPVAVQASEPVSETLAYRAYIGGLPVGTLKLEIAMDEDRYATEARFDIARLFRWVLDTDALASSSGTVTDDGGAVPESFDYWVRDGRKQRNTEMQFDEAGNATAVRADPVFDKRSYDISGFDEVRGAIDPATAVAMLSAPRTGPCDVDMKVFDGRKLHRISMKQVSGDQENARCEGRYERLAGFKAKYMTPERRSYPFNAELRRIGPNRWRPVRVRAKTKFGNAIALLKK